MMKWENEECESCGVKNGRVYYSNSHYYFSAKSAFIPTWKNILIEFLDPLPFNSSYTHAVLCKRCLEYKKIKEEADNKRLENKERAKKLKFIRERDTFMNKYKDEFAKEE